MPWQLCQEEGGRGGEHRVRDRRAAERRRVPNPIGLEVEGVGERPGGDIVEAVVLFVGVLAATAVALEPRELLLHEAGFQGGPRLEHRLGEAALGLAEVHHVAAGREGVPDSPSPPPAGPPREACARVAVAGCASRVTSMPSRSSRPTTWAAIPGSLPGSTPTRFIRSVAASSIAERRKA